MNPDALANGETALAEAEQHLDHRELDAALRSFDIAEMLGADVDRCCAGRWMASMLSGDFGCAWRQSDAIRLRGGPDLHRFWNGENLAGKRVIVRCLHGFGDAVQFLRYAPLLRASAARVIYEVPPRLLELARFFRGVEEVISWGDYAPPIEPRWDVQVEVMELPYIFRTGIGDLPVAEEYLDLPDSVTKPIDRALGPATALRVGLVWSAGEWNPARSIPSELVARLLGNRGCEFWNLQGGSAAIDGTLDRDGVLHSLPGCEDSIVTLAAQISRLDLLITVDTLAAHLAGALGVPAWVLLQHAADWRWMTSRASSPWYPSLRLFRQRSQGDWQSVIHAVEPALHERSLRPVKRLIA